MSERYEITKGLRQAARRRSKADEARRVATAELRELVLRGQGAGMPVTEIAREAGLSRQAVYDLLGARQPS